jgi:hypothetical protein
MHGAALLYNLLIAERYEHAELTELEKPVQRYRDRLADWAQDVAVESDLARWDRADMWNRVVDLNPRINGNVRMKRFVDEWLGAVQTGATATAADDEGLRSLVGERERLVKRAQSRLVNEKLLRAWSGASGSAPLAYRWPQVRREILDIRAGLAVSGAAA